MYDSFKIIPGLLIFVLLITFPIWYNNLIGDVGAAPAKDPNLAPEMLEYANFPNNQKHPPAEEMRATHMELLKGFHVNATAKLAEQKDGKMPTMGCMGCHGSKEKFCDSCHAYAAVTTPDCWTCHTKP
ncbi:MAG: cytochrome C [Candidatus Electrothrix sp. YB6]